MRTCTHTHICMRTHTHTHTHMDMHTHTRSHTHERTYTIHTHKHTHTHIHMHTHTHTHGHAHPHTHECTYTIHTHMNAHTHTHRTYRMFPAGSMVVRKLHLWEVNTVVLGLQLQLHWPCSCVLKQCTSSSLQFKMETMRSEKPICAPPPSLSKSKAFSLLGFFYFFKLVFEILVHFGAKIQLKESTVFINWHTFLFSSFVTTKCRIQSSPIPKPVNLQTIPTTVCSPGTRALFWKPPPTPLVLVLVKHVRVSTDIISYTASQHNDCVTHKWSEIWMKQHIAMVGHGKGVPIHPELWSRKFWLTIQQGKLG